MRRLVLVLGCTLVAAGGGAASASADVYCVSDTACVSTGGSARTTVQAALDAADAHAGSDVVQIGPGTFTAVGPNGFTTSMSGGPVEVRGAGRGSTTLTAPPVVNGSTVTAIRLSVAGSALHDLKIVLPGWTAGSGTSEGVFATGTAIDRIDVAPAPTGSNYTGITFTGTLRDSTSRVPQTAGGAAAVRVDDSGTGIIEDSALSGFYAVYSDTLQATPTTTTVRRSRLTGGPYVVYARGSAVTIESSLMSSSTAGAVGLQLLARANAPTTAAVRGATLTGLTTGVSVRSSLAGATVSATVSSTIIRATQNSLMRAASSGGTANLAVSYSDYTQPPAGASTGPGTLTQTTGNTNVSDARFVDAAAGDFRLRYDSPLLDAGDPAALAAGESATELAGGARVVDGDANGTAVRDVGAFEYQRQAPKAVATVSSAAVPVGQSVTFDASGSQDADAGDTLTYAWAFDDGATVAGPTVQHAFATAGPHSGTLTVSDSSGAQGTAIATVTAFRPPPPPPPVTDRTAPVLTKPGLSLTRFRAARSGAGVTVVKAKPKRTAVGAKLSFSLSEDATVTLTVQRRATGRREGGVCKAPTRAKRRSKPCARYVSVKGSVSFQAKAGKVIVRFSGRIGGRALKAGRYRLAAVPRDAADNTGSAKRVSFTIVH